MRHPFKRYGSQALWTAGIVLGFTSLVLAIVGVSPFSAYYHLLAGSLGSWAKIAQVLRAWIPLTLCACGLLYTFHVKLWNIGVEGQIILGALAATAVLRFGAGGESPWLVLASAALLGLLGGAVWALLAGFLKTRGGVNEIFAGLGLNFVAQGLTLWFIFGPWKRPGIASMSGTEPFPPEIWLPVIPSPGLSPVALGAAVLVLLATGAALRYTKVGLGLRAVGGNMSAARLLDLAPDRWMLLAMILAGGMAGLAGFFQVAGVYHRLIPSISSGYGYLALLVVILSDYRIRGVPGIALFFACLNVGSAQLPLVLQLDSSFSGIVQGACVLAVLCVRASGRRKAWTQ